MSNIDRTSCSHSKENNGCNLRLLYNYKLQLSLAFLLWQMSNTNDEKDKFEMTEECSPPKKPSIKYCEVHLGHSSILLYQALLVFSRKQLKK